MNKELLRKLPKIDELLKEDICINMINKFGRNKVVDSLREVLGIYREKILDGNMSLLPSLQDIFTQCERKIEKQFISNLRRVVNGTGVVIHTNLGRSILSKEAVESIIEVASHYSNLEYNLENGARGSRYSHIENIIREITGAESALVVNNNAAAIMLTINSLCQCKDVIVSRGELVEIGGSFRIPDVIKFSKSTLVEVGTTNKTHLYDYENNINENTGAFLKVHCSNFKIIGFTESVEINELSKLGKKYNIPVIHDIGSGGIIDLSKYGLEKEETVKESIENGADIVTFSGDKVLGGPQAGIIVGKKIYIDKIKKNQLTRALRVDKFTLAALEITLKQYLYEEEAIEKNSTLSMLTISKDKLYINATKLYGMLEELNSKLIITIEEGDSTVGGGAMPDSKLPTYLVKIKSNNISEEILEKMLRENCIPIICRINKGDICIDVRTLLEEDYYVIKEALKEIGERL